MEDRVILLDEHAELAGSKLRQEINKKTDILYCVDILIFTDDRVLLVKTPDGSLYKDTWSSSCATMLRERETTEQAAWRCLKKELDIQTGELTELGERFFTYPDGVKRKKRTFTFITTQTPKPNPEDVSELKSWTRPEIEEALPRNIFAPTFVKMWEVYQTQLPF